jgi:diguanylate cyclase (GGDEF)-like protein/PAS domain S-box-containing protein
MAKTQVFIVEDESLVAKDIQAMVVNLGYAVAGMAASGEKALQKIEENRPDLVLMDIVLKGPLDGIATAELIRARANIPVVYLTAYADQATVARAKRSEPFGYLLKPFEERELQTAIELALHNHARQTQLREREQWGLAILDTIQDAIVAIDAQGRISYLNALSERLTGWTFAEARGRPRDEILVVRPEGSGRFALPSAEALLRRRRWAPRRPLLLVARNLRRIPIEATAALLPDAEGKPGQVIFIIRERTRSRRDESKSFERAVYDALTGLPNSLLLADRWTLAVAQARRKNLRIALILVDLNDLSAISRSRGEDAVDEILRETGRRLRACVRKSDTVARVGPGQFLLALGEFKQPRLVHRIVRRIGDALASPLPWRKGLLSWAASVGFCLFPDQGEDLEDLIRKAEAARGPVRSGGPR